jgi:hypothetical protein
VSDNPKHEASIPFPMRYDIATDQRVPVTQEYFDELERKMRLLLTRPEGLPVGQAVTIPAGLKLACFPNRMREGQVFIAEAKEIEPYLDSDGRAIIDFETSQPYYPPVPKTDWIIHGDVNENFAREIVRRWNSCVWERELTVDDGCVELETEYTQDV